MNVKRCPCDSLCLYRHPAEALDELTQYGDADLEAEMHEALSLCFTAQARGDGEQLADAFTLTIMASDILRCRRWHRLARFVPPAPLG